MISAFAVCAGRAVLDGNKSLRGRGGAIGVGRGDADIVACDAELLREIAPSRIDPAFDIVVPGIGGVAHCLRLFAVPGQVGDVSPGQQRGDFGGQSERRVARIFFPAILLGDRTIAKNKARGLAHHALLRRSTRAEGLARSPRRSRCDAKTLRRCE